MHTRCISFSMLSNRWRIPFLHELKSYSTATSISRRKTKRGTTDKTSRDKILHRDISELLATKNLCLDELKIPGNLIDRFLFAKNTNVVINDVHIISHTSEGEGIGIINRAQYDAECEDPYAKTVVKIPKTAIGDIVKVTLRRHHDYYAEADLVSVSRKSRKQSSRNDRLVICQHFDECGGCQFQMLPYDDQLQFKRDVISRAYRYFFPELDRNKIQNFGFVVSSPMQFAYRTKITPHAAAPRKLLILHLPLPIGFDNVRPASPIVDINSCPIAVPSINQTLPALRNKIQADLVKSVENGSKVESTLVLRDSIRIDHSTGKYQNVCLTDRRKVVTEQIEDFVFQFPANEFFQNNRFILPTFLDFLKYHLSEVQGLKFLVDAYCGSGFLGISLSRILPDDGKLFGIEISKQSIKYAEHNAGINGLHFPDRVEFVHGNSDAIFTEGKFLASGVRGDESVVLMNPSRKGSTKQFMKQLLEFRPKAIVYVSCNVFTQARDLQDFEEFQKSSATKYRIKTITGFDFYPQTKHVEAVALLELIE